MVAYSTYGTTLLHRTNIAGIAMDLFSPSFPILAALPR